MTTTAMPYEIEVAHPASDAFSARLLADWRDVLFVHYAIDPALLQPHMPFDLDLFDGKAWVTLVAFTQVGLRPALGGRLTAWTMRPVATHGFLNLRTYVNVQGRRAIYFIAEWIPNRLAYLVGPRLYGLPFHLGRLDYSADQRRVIAGEETFNLRVTRLATEVGRTARNGTLDHFLLERYTAFTSRNGRDRMFEIRHRPWLANPVEVTVERDSLIRRAAPWFVHASFVYAHASPGVFDVEMSGPRRFAHARLANQGHAWSTRLPLLVLPTAALFFRNLLPSWAFMWALAFGIYFGCKWMTWRNASELARRAGWQRSIGYLFAWPGMDAKAFFAEAPTANAGSGATGITWPIGRILLGAALLFGVARLLPAGAALLSGWIGLTGLILLLHFGLFDLLALAWQSAGVHAVPVMHSPQLARSLGDFWGTRWNRAFRDLVHAGIFTPLLKTIGPARATLAVFLVSGLVHDLIISLPARAGFGLPTLYFLVQGAGMLIEKSSFGRRHLRGVAGRLFAIAVAVLPLPLLFHAPFITRVIVPFMRAIGCL